MALKKETYPASFDVDYPKQLDRFTTFARILWCIPAVILLAILSSSAGDGFIHDAGRHTAKNGGGIMAGITVATALMIIFRQRYPKWWYDFSLELNRFSARVGAYVLLLTDQYPSTVENQAVHLDVEYPNAERDLNRWMPIVKWFLAIPHYIVLVILFVVAIFATILAWFAILFTGQYPRSLFDYVVGVGRWSVRVNAYAFLLTTDKYPPFSLR